MKRITSFAGCVFIALALAGCAPKALDDKPDEALKSTAQTDVQEAEMVQTPTIAEGVTRRYNTPTGVATIKYSAKSPSASETVYSFTKGDIEFAVRDPYFRALPISVLRGYRNKTVKYYINAEEGGEYQLYVHNHSSEQHYEIVATVDGKDVITGKPGKIAGAGYLLRPGHSLTINGFGKSGQTNAGFIFSAVPSLDKTDASLGKVSNAGIIGFAVYELEGKVLPPFCGITAFPGDRKDDQQSTCR